MFINEVKVKIVLFFSLIKFLIGLSWSLLFVPVTIAGLLGYESLKDFRLALVLLTIPGIILIYSSIKDNSLIKRARLYQSIFSQNLTDDITFSDLSKKVGSNEELIIKEVKKLIQKYVLSNVSLDLGDIPKVILGNAKAQKQVQFKTVQCPNCGATVRKKVGFMAICDYCDSEII